MDHFSWIRLCPFYLGSRSIVRWFGVTGSRWARNGVWAQQGKTCLRTSVPYGGVFGDGIRQVQPSVAWQTGHR